MNHFRNGLLVFSLTVLAACGGNKTCEEEEFYESSRLGEPIVVPDDLDDIDTVNELKIPEPSGRPPRPADAGCVDQPPKVGSS